jgi:hypothetical protein
MKRDIVNLGGVHLCSVDPDARKRQKYVRDTYATECNVCHKTDKWLSDQSGGCESCNVANFMHIQKKPTEMLNQSSTDGKHPVEWLYKIWLASGGGTHNLSNHRS